MPLAADPNTFKNQVEGNPVAKIQVTTDKNALNRETQVIHLAATEWRDVDCDELQKCGNVFHEDHEGMVAQAIKFGGYTAPADKML